MKESCPGKIIYLQRRIFLSFLMVMISGWKTNKHTKRDQVPRIFSGKIYKTFKLSLNENPWCKPTDSFLYQNSTASLKVKKVVLKFFNFLVRIWICFWWVIFNRLYFTYLCIYTVERPKLTNDYRSNIWIESVKKKALPCLKLFALKIPNYV